MKILENYAYLFLPVLIGAVCLHVTALLFARARQHDLKTRGIKVSNVKFLSINPVDRLQGMGFMLNIFDPGSEDAAFRSYVWLWRLSGYATTALFILFLLGEH